MSELRTKYPQAQAWTFVLPDTPPTTRPTGPGAGRRAGPAAAAVAPVATHKKSGSFGASSSSGGGYRSRSSRTEGENNMGGLCSSSKNVANKENVGQQAAAEGSTPQTAESIVRATTTAAVATDAAASADAAVFCQATSTASSEACVRAGAENGVGGVGSNGAADGMLDATAFLSPDPDEPAGDESDAQLLGNSLEGICLEEEVEKDGGDGSAWLARSLGLLRGGKSVDVAQVKQVIDGDAGKHRLPLILRHVSQYAYMGMILQQ